MANLSSLKQALGYLGRGIGVQADTMRSTAWIWFVGCAVWIIDGFVNARFHAWAHAKLAFTVAVFFLAAGLFYQQQRR